MHKYLIIKAFEKAKKEVESKKLTHWSTYLSDFIYEDTGEQYGEKSLRTHYNKAKRNSDENIELKSYVTNSLSIYLGYDSYLHFLKENQVEGKKSCNNDVSKIRKKKKNLGLIIIAILTIYFGYDMVKKNCMIWQGGYYVKVKCNNASDIKSIPYNEVILNNFKQVIKPDCNYLFFKSDGSENLWYGKSAKGELEFFTYYGLHPTTGKTLNPITQYMINKYICE